MQKATVFGQCDSHAGDKPVVVDSNPKNELAERFHDFLRLPVAKWIAAALILGIAGLFAYHMYLSNSRYQVIQTSRGVVYELDHQTGRAWVIRGDTKVESIDPAGPTKQQTAPPALAARISARIGPSTSRGSFSGDIHNGTGWTLTELDLQLTLHFKDGDSWSRLFRVDVSVKPFKSDHLSFDVAERREVEKFTWALVEAKGHPQD